MPEAQQRVAPTYSRRSRSAIFAGPLLVALSLVLVVAGGWYTDVRRPLPDPLQPVEGLQWWFTPVERNAFMRLPVVTGNLYAVDASDDGQIIWAVGENSLIVGTTDGGRTWRRGKVVLDEADAEAGKTKSKPAAAERKPAAAAFNILDTFNPVAVARAGDIRKQVDVAQQVEVRQQYENAPAPNEPAYDSKQELSKEADASNAIQQSSDSTAVAAPPQIKVDRIPSPELAPGQSKQQPPPRIDRSQVQQNAPQIMEQGAVARDTRSERDRLLNSTLNGVAVIDARRAIAVGENGLILFTQDGGETWQQQESGSTAHLLSVAFADADTGISVGVGGTVLRTVDGGMTWRSEPLKSGGMLWDVAAANAQNWVIAGQDGLLVHSVDGGQNWKSLPPPANETLRGVAFGFNRLPVYKNVLDSRSIQDAPLGVVGTSTKLWFTHDGGEQWSSDDAADWGDIGRVEDVAISGREVVVLAGDRKLYRNAATEGGQWSGKSIWSRGRAFHRITAIPNGRLFVVGEEGVLLASGDGGEHWTPLTAHARIFNDLDVDAAGRGAIVGAFGTVLTTSDAGATWTARRSSVTDDLVDVKFGSEGGATAMLFDARRATEYIASRDGGATWQPVDAPSATASQPAPFNVPPGVSNQSFGNARLGLVVTDDKISRTENAGAVWQEVTAGTTAPIVDVVFASDEHAVALAQGRVLLSKDAGKTFEPVGYKHYPSPWLWVACAVLLVSAASMLRRSLRKPEVEQQPSSITDAAASDRPIEWGDPDPAGLRDIALGLSRFLRNRRTEPPLTIAVTGEWGTGKSSLMNLLRHDLMRYGYKPVWFNAWHHQSGENLLGSLLANIHAQGVPPLHTVAGLDFRLTLLAIRSRRFWWRLALTLFLIAVVFFSYETLGASASKLWAALTADSENGVAGGISNIGAATGLLGIMAAVLTPIVGAVRAASAFGLQPAKLIAAVATTRHDESARIQAGARYRFAREFADFTRALDPRPLVIFIDDLDRCRAENVIEVLEAVNFLISSGRCIVVIGMARRWVETCVGLAFKELAQAHIEKRDDATTDYDPLNAPLDATTERQLFAKHYLEKLINVEIRVPRLSDSAAGAILQGSEFATPSNHLRYGLGTALLRTAAAVVSIAIVAGVIVLGKSTADWLGVLDSKASSPPQALMQPTTDAPAQQSAPLDTEAQSPLDEDRPVVFDAPRAPTSMGWYFSTGTSVTFVLAAFLAVAMFARKESRTDDSPAFREALSILQPWIMVGGASPRSLKRFINHVRYIAMRFRPGADIPTTYEKFTNRMRVWFGRAPIDTGNSGVPQRLQLSEELLVALATLHRCNESWLDELFIARERDLALLLIRDIGPQIDDPDERQAVLKRLRESIDKFNERFSDSELFENEMLDRRHAIAFYEVMAFETGVREQAPLEEAAPPRPLRQA